ncbi:hypothetical protein GPALN_003640 [Globodera pallida]|nr:hypothetical protein GPALN_003640 [Globodera pallida]
MHLFGRKGKKVGGTVGKAGKEEAQQQQRLLRLRVLGVPLAQAVRNNPSYDGVPVPAVVRECLDFISLYGLQVEGVYRVSSPKSRLDDLEKLTNDGRLDEIVFQDAHEAAGLLKRFLHQLPENILTPRLSHRFDREAKECQCVGLCRCSAAVRLKELLLQLPSENFHLLAFVFRNVQLVIQKESANKMSLPAMGVLLQAMLDLPRNVVKLFITNAAEPTTEGGPSSAVQLFDSVDIGP